MPSLPLPPLPPEKMGNIVTQVMKVGPRDLRLIAQRLYDHALEPRMPPGATKALVADLGYRNLREFCAAIGLPEHIADRWSRFGISSEMRQVLLLVTEQRLRMIEAIEEFESMTHCGIDDFLKSRGLMD
ncbi:hypothetical protein [Limoniibacter endophyticus]|uniref:Uncharacterized protein n=1 Tax=Limoniibacter endophyticus TaxID=1565040 RepID=A0A8J3DMA1_9HYPH|nr:hypothetical protein [Limoniibacter endophyticus]GHC70223.1 hypothetical protein GCM10010136_16310 [Limoniibacter endophyticus]